MGSIATAGLRVEGLEGIEKILSFSFNHFPGEHARGMLQAISISGRKDWEKERELHNRWIKVLIQGEISPLFTGRIQLIQGKEENGYHQITLELISGTILMDMKKESHSYQDVTMSYGEIFKQVADQGNGTVLYPDSLDNTALEFPKIQYEETDWNFLKRLASHFELSLYPQIEQERAGLSVGIPPAKPVGNFSWREYTVVWDGRYYELGGKEAGYTKDRFIGYEVESEENYACGQRVLFHDRELTICTKSCRSEKGELLFTYRLAYPEWTGQKRIQNQSLSGLSLLGRVVSRAGETLKLELDIDREHPDQTKEKAYSFSWRPPTGNLMYMMPAEGSQVSLYFPSAEETGAIAINCVRQMGEAEGNDYQERGLKVDGKQLKLYPTCMGLESLTGRVLLDDLEGISIAGKRTLRIGGNGKVRIEGKEITLDSGKGDIDLYHQKMDIGEGDKLIPTIDGQFHLMRAKNISMNVSLAEYAYLLGYEHEDYSGEEFRFKDDPVEKNYWEALGERIRGSVVTIGSVAALSALGAGLAGVSVSAVVLATAAGGAITVGGIVLSDVFRGRVSSMNDYIRAALSGSIIGAMTGAASQLLPKNMSLIRRAGTYAGMGAFEAGVEAIIWDGEVTFEQLFKGGLLGIVFGMMADEIGTLLDSWDVIRIIKGVENGRIKLTNNLQKGNYGEMKMDVYLKKQGYERISLDKVTDLNALTHQGIDGVYYNPNGHPPYTIAEAKYGSSKLRRTKDGMQMSDTWIHGSNRLVNSVGKDIADDILLEGYDKILVNITPNGTVNVTKLN